MVTAANPSSEVDITCRKAPIAAIGQKEIDHVTPCKSSNPILIYNNTHIQLYTIMWLTGDYGAKTGVHSLTASV